ncbi:hypothetical protein RIF29_12094 [Crotalaria pallida]|uniref:Oleosin n=1 Tax=Crotalaria pallida TaxID=3830 RepID=A0AAN9P1U4_CROPI
MTDQTRTGTYGSSYDNTVNNNNNSTTRQTIKFLTAATIGVSLMLLSGLILTGTVIGLAIATPLLVLFSPILVPAAFVLFLAASGFLFSGGCGVAAVAALSWIYNYVAGKHPVGADKLDYAKGMIADKARDVKNTAKDYATYATQGTTQGSTY